MLSEPPCSSGTFQIAQRKSRSAGEQVFVTLVEGLFTPESTVLNGWSSSVGNQYQDLIVRVQAVLSQINPLSHPAKESVHYSACHIHELFPAAGLS
jgi:hypothetical protein